MKSAILFLLATCTLSAAEPSLKNATHSAGIPLISREDYFFGTSYYPEQWPRTSWKEDFKKMHDLGFNVVRMGEFAWSRFEPSEDTFDFGWMDNAIEEAGRNGLSVILGTPTGSIPPWLYKKHPDVLGANDKGPLTYGGRKGFSPDAPAMREAAEKLIGSLADHYATNPSVIGWQISNEPGFPFENYDNHSLNAFRNWLKTRYGSISNLNQSWVGMFWSNQYNDWDEIRFPVNSAEGGWRPGSSLDYRRFFSDSFIAWLRFESDVLKRHSSSSAGQFRYINWPDTLWSVDVFKAAELGTYTAWDNYSMMPGLSDYRDQFYAGLNHDLSRCSQTTQRFFVAEQLARAPANADRKSIRLQTYIDLAHGSSGTLFYEWRSPLGGNEAGYPSVLGLDGSYGPDAAEYRRMACEYSRIAPLLREAKTESDLAMLFSYDNEWDQGFWAGVSFRSTSGYDGAFKRYYAGMKALHRNIDVIPADKPLSKYRMVVSPGLRMVGDRTAKALNDYVSGGGILVLNAKAGTREMDARLRPMIGPGVFAEAAGVTIPRLATLRGCVNDYTVRLNGQKTGHKVENLMEELHVQGVQAGSGVRILGTFSGHGMEGKPAVTIHPHGNGYLVYVAAEIDDRDFYDSLFSMLGETFRIPMLLQAPKEVEVVSRQLNGSEFLFLLNLCGKERRVPWPRDQQKNGDLLLGNATADQIILPPFEVAILRRFEKKSPASPVPANHG
jgi:beta-galactosidase